MFAANRFRAKPLFRKVLRDDGAQHSLNSSAMRSVALFLGRHGYRAGRAHPVHGEQRFHALATPRTINLNANRSSKSCPLTPR